MRIFLGKCGLDLVTLESHAPPATEQQGYACFWQLQIVRFDQHALCPKKESALRLPSAVPKNNIRSSAKRILSCILPLAGIDQSTMSNKAMLKSDAQHRHHLSIQGLQSLRHSSQDL